MDGDTMRETAPAKAKATEQTPQKGMEKAIKGMEKAIKDMERAIKDMEKEIKGMEKVTKDTAKETPDTGKQVEKERKVLKQAAGYAKVHTMQVIAQIQGHRPEPCGNHKSKPTQCGEHKLARWPV